MTDHSFLIHLVNIIKKVVNIEDEIVQRYLEIQALKLRTSIQASYSVIIQVLVFTKFN